MKRNFLVLAAGLFSCQFLPTLPAATEPGILWDVKILESRGLNDVASDGSGRLVAVGNTGIIHVSNDHGESWAAKNSNVLFDLKAVTWTGSYWVTLGASPEGACVILNSPDAEDWQANANLGMPAPLAMAWGSSMLLVVGDYELTAHSNDLIVWHGQRGAGYRFNDVVWTGSQWVAVGNSGRVKTSPDGETWTLHTNGLTQHLNLRSVAWNGSNLVAVGVETSTGFPMVATSSDGSSWTVSVFSGLPGVFLNAVEWTGTSFVAMGNDGYVFTSPNGTGWTRHQTPGGDTTVQGLCWDGTYIVAVGLYGTVLRTAEASPDEESDWAVLVPEEYSHPLNDIATGNVAGTERAVVVSGRRAILHSDDGFEIITIRLDEIFGQLNGVAATGLSASRFVAVGSNGKILTSPDAETWTPRISNTFNDLFAVDWFKPFDSGTPFAVAVGENGTILTSSNLSSWTAQASHTSEWLYDVAVGSVYVKPIGSTRRIVAVGTNGTILYSSGGTTWKTASVPAGTPALAGVAALDTGFAAVGHNGTILTSSNGTTWTARTSGTTAELQSVAWTGNQIIAVGNDGVVLTSPNKGIHWHRRYAIGTIKLKAVASLESGRLAAVGLDGLISTSDPSPDFNDWIAAQLPPHGQDGPDDDPNGDGVTNLLAYALGMPAVGPSSEDFDALPRLVRPTPGRPLLVGFGTAAARLPDIAYIGETSTTLAPGSWTEVVRNVPGQFYGTGSIQILVSPPPDNSAFLLFPETIGEHERFFTRLRIEQTP